MMSVVKYDLEVLDEDALRDVKRELRETDDNRRKCLGALKKKLLNTSDLDPNLDENFLIAFLRVAKYDVVKAYQRVICMYTERYNQPNIYGDYRPDTVKGVESARQFYASPYRAKDNSCVLIVKRMTYDPSKLEYDVILRASCMLGDLLLQHPLNQLFGFTFILDLKSSSWGNWNEYTPARLRLIARTVQKSMSLRIRAIHILNAPPVYYFLYSIIYPFLSSKIRNRIYIHKSNSSLHHYVDPEILPKEYEGCLEQSDLINLYDRLYGSGDFLPKLSKYGFGKKVE